MKPPQLEVRDRELSEVQIIQVEVSDLLCQIEQVYGT